ncbi:Holliday junction resolvase RecU [Litchfieldia alkalitelluris]|uniref:Holliday junction resolvase RecU n=1 Tax=Litchfieldia alkalitelluris TaxID=304268 RepID=UPI000998405F|nr:Holliday junction resolvase RecU [Litchfieldia alkalitelluris]
MNFRYPNGKVFQPKESTHSPYVKKPLYSNRGMTLEEDINETNLYYLNNQLAVIHKKPTPVQIVNVSYPKRSAAVIKEAYFKQASTTDYNGIYNGKYIDFEAKETRNKTSFPLQNFHEHQINHMRDVLQQKGICFVLLRFSSTNEIFYLDASFLLSYWKRHLSGGRRSIKKEEIEQEGHKIPLGYHPRIDYLKVIDKLYF